MDPTLTAAAIGVGGTVIVGIAGFWANVRNTNKITEGQLTDRYSAAVEQLGSGQLDVRIGGIYALERIARDSPRDHPTIMEVLVTFVREHSREQRPRSADELERITRPDIQAALTVIGRRTTKYDRKPHVLHLNLAGADLSRADLTGASLGDANLADANLTHTDLTDAKLTGADLTGATLAGADLTDADLTSADLTRVDLAGAQLTRANLTSARLFTANLTSAQLTGADLTRAQLGVADLTRVDLTGARLTRANLTGARLTRANLTGARLTGADLTRAQLGIANLTRADLTGADVTHANFTSVLITGATGSGADLTGAIWPAVAAIPEGWKRDTNSGRLRRADTNPGGAPPGPAAANLAPAPGSHPRPVPHRPAAG